MCRPQFFTNKFKDHCSILQSLPSRGAWIEIKSWSCKGLEVLSLPSRGAWIEMSDSPLDFVSPEPVAPLTGSVDRNFKWMFKTFVVPVGGVVNQNGLTPAPFPAPILNCISGLRCRPEMQFIFL